jgi:hypothetical protein
MEKLISLMTILLQASESEESSASVEPFVVDAFYWPNPAFLKVLRTVSIVNPTQFLFNYRDITAFLSHYIMSGKERLFKNNNWKVAIVKGDILGKAFGVDKFTREQVTALMRQQLVRYRGAIKPELIINDPDLDSKMYPFIDEMKN